MGCWSGQLDRADPLADAAPGARWSSLGSAAPLVDLAAGVVLAYLTSVVARASRC